MLIKHKLFSNVIIIVVSMLAMLILLSYTSSSFKKEINITKNLGDIKSSILQLRRGEKDFLARKNLKYQAEFNHNFIILQNKVMQLKTNLKALNLTLQETSALQTIIIKYHQHFTQLVESQEKIGLNPKDGLYGILRARVHKVEKLIGQQNFQLLSGMLQLRRNEKDFMLRLNQKYVDKFIINFNKLQEKVNPQSISDSNKVSRLLQHYKKAFINLVDQQKIIGLTPNKGLQGKMRTTIHQVDRVLTRLHTTTEKQIIDHTHFINILTYCIIVVILLIAIIIAWVINNNILKRILSLRNSIVIVAENNELTLQIDTQSKDELADIIIAFNRMLTNFRSIIVTVNDAVISVNKTATALSKNMTQPHEGGDIQAQEAENISTAILQMSSTIEEIARNTLNAANRSEMTNTNTILGKQAIVSTISQIELLSGQLQNSEQVAHELAKDSDTIGSVLDVIRSIADQTNLLALNAAIEAARAGEQGRGFAVVADEVRTLASRTQESTKEIELIIHSLQNRTKNFVQLMTECREQGNESTHKANATNDKLEEINLDVSTIKDMNTTIATAIEEQATVAAQIGQSVGVIRTIVEASNENAQQNERISGDLSYQAKILHTEVSRFII